MQLIAEFWMFMKARKKLWLLPLVLVFGLLGVLLIVGGSGSAIAPFIYTLF